MSSVSSNNGAHVLHIESLRDTDRAAAEAHDSSFRLRFNSLTLDELSDELDRRTKETQRLQEEVENATKAALERFGCKYGISTSLGQSYDNHGFDVYNPAGDATIFPTHTQGVIQHVDSGVDILNQEVVQRLISSPGENILENALDGSSDQPPGLQLRKTHDQTEQGTFSVDKAIVDLQTKLREVQIEKDVLSDLRLKDSRNHVDQMEKMLCMLEELQNIKRAADQKLQDTEDEALALSRKVETLEQIMKETYSTLCSHENRCGNSYVRNESNEPQKRCLMPGVWSEKHSGENTQKQRSEELIASVCQEMALLTEQLSSSKLNSVSLSVKLELLKKLTERRTSLHQCHTSEDKSGCEQQPCQLQVEVKALRGGLEEAKEQLHKVGEEENCLQAQDQRTQVGRKSQELLQEKDEELPLRLLEAQQTLHIDGETLRLRLDDREKLIDILQLQLESSAQVKAQHINTIDNLHHKNLLLSNQLNQHKLEIQQLRAEIDQHKSDLAIAEHEKRHLQASVSEQSQRVREEILEKRQITSQLEIQRMQLLALRKEHEEQQRLHSCKSDEQEGVVMRLRSQLRDTHDELDQVRITLRTLEGADGHGLRVALDMQKEITARREQVDSLQSKIKHLQETVEKLHQERSHQSRENQRQLRALTFVREEKKQLSSELEALHSKDQQLRDRISQLEAILHKVESHTEA